MCTVFAQANVESYLCTTMCNKCKTGLKLKWISVTYYCHTLLYGWAVNISHKIFVSVNHRWSLSPCSALWPVGLVLCVFLEQLRHSSHRWECCHLFVLCSVQCSAVPPAALYTWRCILCVCVCEDNIRMDLQEVGWGAWTGLKWLRIGTGGGLLWMR